MYISLCWRSLIVLHLNFQSNLVLHRRGSMSYFALFGTPESKTQTMSFDVALILFYSDENTQSWGPGEMSTRSVTTGVGFQNPFLTLTTLPHWPGNFDTFQLLVQITPTKISIALVNKITPPNSLIWGGLNANVIIMPFKIKSSSSCFRGFDISPLLD